MLVLRRKAGEKIVLGEHGEITITVIDLNGNQVRLGFDAPVTTKIMREELLTEEEMPRW